MLSIRLRALIVCTHLLYHDVLSESQNVLPLPIENLYLMHVLFIVNTYTTSVIICTVNQLICMTDH